MEIKETFEHQFSFTQEEVNNFSKVTGDTNPIHINEDIAKKSIFKKMVIHGFLSGSVFSKVFGTIWPGNGAIYLSQTMRFLKPMYTKEKYIAKFEVVEILPKNKFVVKTIIVDAGNDKTLEGEAVIKFDQDSFH
jgi:3-hydroxybutyryl-CoA dehydratase